jgi:hypothetical protein
MRTPGWVGHVFAIGSGLFKLLGVVSLMAAMVALELVTRERSVRS